jgi:hypothetical protein
MEKKMSTRTFVVDPGTGEVLTFPRDAVGMINASKIKIVRVPVLLANHQGLHVLELSSELCDLILSGVGDRDVLMQYAQLRESWRVDDESYDRFLRSQIKLPEPQDETEADLLGEGEDPWTDEQMEAHLARRKREGLKIDRSVLHKLGLTQMWDELP